MIAQTTKLEISPLESDHANKFVMHFSCVCVLHILAYKLTDPCFNFMGPWFLCTDLIHDAAGYDLRQDV